MENLQDTEMELLPIETEQSDVVRLRDDSDGGECEIDNSGERAAAEDDWADTRPLLTQTVKRTEGGSEVIRAVFIVILCSLSVLFYSGLAAAKFRVYLSDGVPAMLMSDALAHSSAEGEYVYGINGALLNILSAPMKKTYPRFEFPKPSEKSDTELDETEPQAEDEPQDAESDSPVMPVKSAAEVRTYPIVEMDLSSKADGGLSFHNETAYSPDAAALLASALPIRSPDETAESYGDDAPLVLILHTHGTESYSPEGSSEYDDTQTFRSEDVSENVVAVGAVMADVLQENGINTIHCTIMHDKDSYRDSYSRSLETIKSFIKEYPSIQYIFDVHRDSVIQSDRTCIRPVTEIDGVEAAQFMTVVGTNFKGADHPNWEKNLALAVRLQSKLAEKYTNFVRSINLRSAGFNANTRPARCCSKSARAETR